MTIYYLSNTVDFYDPAESFRGYSCWSDEKFNRPCMPCGTAFERWYPYCYQSNHQVTNEVSKILSGQDRKSLMALSAWLCCDMNLRKFSEEVACVGPVRGHHGS